MQEPPRANRKWLAFGGAALLLLCVGVFAAAGGYAAVLTLARDAASIPTPSPQPTPIPTLEPTPEALVNPVPFQAVVQIVAFYEEDGEMEVGWTGSGTIISPDGFILTNAHVVLPNRYLSVDAIGVALTEREDRPPKPVYYAEVLQADQGLDVAVLRVVSDLEGQPVDHTELGLPFVPLGDADQLTLGDEITILGYPGIGGETITLARGEVSGFTSEPDRGDRAFIKTTATIAGGNSGGLAADPQGFLIGIPTQLGYGGDDRFVDCRVLEDTNRDGRIDSRDSCVPAGGFINALRPINLALPLIEAAREGLVEVTSGQAPLPDMELPADGGTLFEDDFSDPTGEWVWVGERGSYRYLNEELRVSVDDDYSYKWGVSGRSYTDVIVDVDSRLIQKSGDSDFGVICRYQDTDNFYGMEISENGYFAIWKFSAGHYTLLVDWRASSYVLKNYHQAHFTAACIGDTLALAVNGEFLAEVRDSAFSSGDVGLVVGTLESGGAAVGFDDFIVTSAETP